jgi:hypothetical protein
MGLSDEFLISPHLWDWTCAVRRIQQGYEAMKLNTRILSLELFHCLLAALWIALIILENDGGCSRAVIVQTHGRPFGERARITIRPMIRPVLLSTRKSSSFSSHGAAPKCLPIFLRTSSVIWETRTLARVGGQLRKHNKEKGDTGRVDVIINSCRAAPDNGICSR